MSLPWFAQAKTRPKVSTTKRVMPDSGFVVSALLYHLPLTSRYSAFSFGTVILKSGRTHPPW